jgi:putative hydrolase of the HAD superfamily
MHPAKSNQTKPPKTKDDIMAEHAIKCILWDLGDVLVSLDFKQLFDEICPLFDTTPEAFHKALFQTTNAFDRTNRGITTSEEFHQEVCDALHKQVPFASFHHAWSQFFQPRPGMGQLLAQLKGTVPMWLLSNTDPLHHKTCQQRYDYLTHLDGQLTSYGLQAMKPEPEISQRALEHIQAKPEQTLFFDDKQENIDGARNMGIQAHLFTSEEECRSILQAHHLLS